MPGAALDSTPGSPSSTGALSPASPLVRTLPPTPPAACFARLPAAPSVPSATQSPWWLPSAGFPGVDSPLAHTAGSAVLTARGGLGSHTPRSKLRVRAFALLACPTGHLRRLQAPPSCWSERLLRVTRPSSHSRAHGAALVAHRYTFNKRSLPPRIILVTRALHANSPGSRLTSDPTMRDNPPPCAGFDRFLTRRRPIVGSSRSPRSP